MITAPTGFRSLPDTTICRVKSIGASEIFECLVDNPIECSHALSFGDAFFCRYRGLKKADQYGGLASEDDAAKDDKPGLQKSVQMSMP